MAVPFRWDVTRREQLGRLVLHRTVETYPQFEVDLLRCCARVIAMCDDADLVFVGRSPENLFDYLSGLFQDTSWRERVALFNFSWRRPLLRVSAEPEPVDLRPLHDHMRSLSLSPADLIHRERPVAFVDLVHSGGTLGQVAEIVLSWARGEQRDEPAVRRKMRFVGITERTKNSPNTWRWQQRRSWTSQFPARSIKNVSVPRRFWTYLGDIQHKVALSNPPWRWGDAMMRRPPRSHGNLDALALALHLYDQGCSDEHRGRLVTELVEGPGMRHAWVRTLVGELRGTTS